MQTYTYAPTKGTLAGRRFEVELYDFPSLPIRSHYFSGTQNDQFIRPLYERDMNVYYRNMHTLNVITILELLGADGKEKKRITPDKSDPVHTFEKVCKKFARVKIQDDPSNRQVSLVTLLADTPKTF